MPGAVAADAPVDDTEQTVLLENCTPKRIQRSVVFNEEQRRLLPGISDDLRLNIGEQITAALDRFALLATSNGLLTAGTAANAPAATVSDWEDFADAVTQRVDGIYAKTTSDVRLLLRASSYALAGKVYRSNQTDTSAMDFLVEKSGGVLASAYPASTSDIDRALAVLGRWPRSSVQPIWEGVELTDVFSESKKATVRLTVAAYTDIRVLRAGAYTRLRFRTAA